MNNEFPGYTRNELMDLMNEYNNYIMQANDDNDYKNGWRPVSICEFEQNEYQDILEEREEESVDLKELDEQIALSEKELRNIWLILGFAEYQAETYMFEEEEEFDQDEVYEAFDIIRKFLDKLDR